MKKPMIPCGFLVVEAQYARLQRLAERTEQGVGQLLRQALDEFLAREDGTSPSVARRAPPIWRDEHNKVIKTRKPRRRQR